MANTQDDQRQPKVGTSAVVCDEHPWTRSHTEEVISALWFIIAGIAHLCGCSPWLFWIIIAKATFDSIESIICAVREWRHSHTKEAHPPSRSEVG